MRITLLTLNLAGYGNWQDREKLVIDALDQASADVVMLQEVRYDPVISPLTQANYVNTLLERPYRYSFSSVPRFYTPSVGEPIREGLAILSNFPLNNPESLVLTKAPDDKHTRIIQTVCVDINGVPVNLVNVHFSNNKYSIGQLNETLSILNSRGADAIVAGDFNIFDINNERASFDNGYIVSTDISPYVSFPSENATLDYVLLPKMFRFLSIDTLDAASDHLGILAHIDK